MAAILLYGFIANRSTFFNQHVQQRPHHSTICSLEQALHDIPVRLSISDSESTFTSRNNASEWLFGNALSALSFAKRMVSYNSHTAGLVIGFERKDVIYPFHYFF